MFAVSLQLSSLLGYSWGGGDLCGGILDDTNQDERVYILFGQMTEKSDAELWEFVVHGDCDEKHAASMELQNRGGDANFRKTLEFCRSPEPLVRDKCAFILGQIGVRIGVHESPFSQEAAPVLIELMENDACEDVRASAAFALGHLRNTIAIPHLLRYVKDGSAEVRHGVAFALCSFEGREVAEALIDLSCDSDRDVRDWATTGLGSFLEMDSTEIRSALLARLSEDDPEIRGEALIGLAKRKDERVTGPLKSELSGEFHGSWCLEAAELMADPVFYPLLLSLRSRIESEVEDRFIRHLDDALTACHP
jgi:HEAT repeat protein